MNYFLQALKKYATFTGRARRKEYWFFVLFLVIFALIAMIIDNLAGTTIGGYPYGVFYSLVFLSTILPSLAVLVRRLHDVGKSGWFYFIALIPILGWIWLLVLLFKEGDSGSNKYGDDPKNDEA